MKAASTYSLSVTKVHQRVKGASGACFSRAALIFDPRLQVPARRIRMDEGRIAEQHLIGPVSR
jgi:hypothetical protein